MAAPQLRGLLASQLKRDFVIACGVSVLAFAAYRFGIQNPRRHRYAEFYKNYDAQKDFERMRNAGVFRSVRPDGEVGDGW